jgi:hypothetical protein
MLVRNRISQPELHDRFHHPAEWTRSIALATHECSAAATALEWFATQWKGLAAPRW